MPPPFSFFSYCLHCKTPCVYFKHVCTQFYMCVNFFPLQLTLCFSVSLAASAAELAEHQVSGEEGTKDMVTGSRLSTSVCQLCMCLHLTPAKSPSGSLPHSPLHITSIQTPPHPPTPKVFLPTVEETLQPRHTCMLLQQCSVPHLNHTHTPPSRPTSSYRKL